MTYYSISRRKTFANRVKYFEKYKSYEKLVGGAKVLEIQTVI